MATNSENSPEIVVGLDLGTTKVSAVVGEVDADGITILGVGNVPCRGLRKGVVSQHRLDGAQRSREAIEAAQTMAGVEITHRVRRRRRQPHPQPGLRRRRAPSPAAR